MNKKILWIIIVVALIAIIEIEQYSDFFTEDVAEETTTEAFEYPIYYQIYIEKSVTDKSSSKLSDLQSLTVYCYTNATWNDWESKNHTAKIIIESDGILFEENELEIEDFPSSKHSSKGWKCELAISEDDIYKSVGSIKITLQRKNDDETVSDMSEYILYYGIKGNEVRFTYRIDEVVDYLIEGCETYTRNLEEYSFGYEEIWIEPDTSVLYWSKTYCEGDADAKTEIEEYTYEEVEKGKYKVTDHEGNQVFAFEEVVAGEQTDKTGIMTDDGKYFELYHMP